MTVSADFIDSLSSAKLANAIAYFSRAIELDRTNVAAKGWLDLVRHSLTPVVSEIFAHLLHPADRGTCCGRV
jgi:hypothetical protein